MAITVLVVDDSSFMRSILSRIIERDERFKVVGTAVNGKEAIEKAAELSPDVITMDIEMPVMNGIDALEAIMRDNPRPVVMVSSLTEEGAAATLRSLEKGAVDFIPKALDDKDKNIFHVGGVLHEKLAAAAQSKPSQGFVQRQRSFEAAVGRASQVGGRTEKFAKAKLLVIGSSTGGPKALQSIVPNLAANLRVPVVLAQHMPPTFTKAMAERFDNTCAITVQEAQNGVELKAGTFYVAPGGMHTRVVQKGSGLILDVRPDSGNECVYKPSVDILAASAAESVGDGVLAVMLTGMGADGAKGFEEISKKGGYIISQNKETCVVYGMPKAVEDRGISREVLPIEEIASTISRLLA